MRRLFLLSMFAAVAMVCSCQKNDSLVQQQLAQRKLELDARDEQLTERKSALEEKEKALDEREKSLAEKENAMMNAQANPTAVLSQAPDPAQVQAEKDSILEELPVMTPDPLEMDVEKAEKEKEEQRAQKLRGGEDLQTQKEFRSDELKREQQRKLDAVGMSPAP